MKRNDALLNRLKQNRKSDVEPIWSKQRLPEPIAISVILYPGLLSERTAALLTQSHQSDTIQLISSALAVTLINLSLAIGICRLLSTHFQYFQWSDVGISDVAQKPVFIVTITIVSVFIGVVWAVIDSQNIIYKLHLTDRRSRSDLFSTVAARAIDDGQWVRVATKDAGAFHGLLKYHDSSSNGGLYLLGPRLELDGNRKADRIGAVLAKCGKAACRINIPCVETGVLGVGAMYIPTSQILAVEFRPVGADTPSNSAGVRRYSCDLQLDAAK